MNWWNFYTPQKVRYVTPQDITGSGATLASVKKETIYRLDDFIRLSGRKILVLPNGLTTGKHDSWTHEQGQAVDIAFRETNGVIVIRHLVIHAFCAGFTQVGVYWNGTAHSMHLGYGTVGQWARWRHHRDTEWQETALIADPKQVEMEARPM